MSSFKKYISIAKTIFLISLWGFIGNSLYSQNESKIQNINELKSLVKFLENQETNAKEYIIQLFDNYDIVVLQERDHREVTQYDLILDIVNDPKFINKVGNIHMEVGTSNSFERINKFLRNDSLSQNAISSHLLNIIRNNDFEPLWEKYNYPYFIENLYRINKSLPKEKKLVVYPSDMAFSWGKTRTSAGYYLSFILKNRLFKGSSYRDRIIGENLVKNITAVYEAKNQKRKKHLVIMNAPHAYLVSKKSASGWVKEAFPNEIVNVYIGTLTRHGKGLIANGKWDAAIQYTDKSSIGFDLKDTPFGQTEMRTYTLTNDQKGLIQQFYHGFIFYKPIEKHLIAYGYPNFIDETFRNELRRRNRIRKPFRSYKKGNWEQYNTVEKSQYENIESFTKQREKWLDSLKTEKRKPSP